jgi:hypothetical protein
MVICCWLINKFFICLNVSTKFFTGVVSTFAVFSGSHVSESGALRVTILSRVFYISPKQMVG